MAIPPDLDVTLALQRIDALSSTVAGLMARVEEAEHRIRTLEVVRRIDLVLADDGIRDGMLADGIGGQR